MRQPAHMVTPVAAERTALSEVAEAGRDPEGDKGGRVSKSQFVERPTSRSIRLDAREPDHLAPLLGLVGKEFAEIGWRAEHHGAAKVSKSRLDLAICKAGVDPTVELVRDVGGGSLRGANTEPSGRFVAWQEIANRRDVRKSLPTRRRGYS
jgi:hypothetical protein